MIETDVLDDFDRGRGLKGLTVLNKSEMDKQSSYLHDPFGSTHPRVGEGKAEMFT